MLNLERNRRVWGEREVSTLLTVLNIADRRDALDGKFIVDLGCGDEHMKEALECRGAIYRGIDVNDCDLETESIPIIDEACDIVVSMALIEHLKDAGNFLSEVRRILKPGGVLWMETPDIEACGNKFWNDPTHVHPYTRASLRTVLEISGFKSIVVMPNYRCKPKKFYRETDLNFFWARNIMFLSGTSNFPIPDLFKGRCSGLFSLAMKAPVEPSLSLG